jgi:hypothetical protein
VCSEVLTEANANKFINGMHYHYTCREHEIYAKHVRIQPTQLRLGYIDEYPAHMKNCNICQALLTKDEIKTIDDDHNIITCTTHRQVAKWLQTDLAKQWCEYKELHPNTTLNNGYLPPEFFQWQELKNNPS